MHFLKAQKNESFENLRLALQWNRIDIAKSDIFNGEEKFTSEQLFKLLEIALVEDKPEFVALLIENGVFLEQFLTYGRLYYLYNSFKVIFVLFTTLIQTSNVFFKTDKIRIKTSASLRNI